MEKNNASNPHRWKLSEREVLTASISPRRGFFFSISILEIAGKKTQRVDEFQIETFFSPPVAKYDFFHDVVRWRWRNLITKKSSVIYGERVVRIEEISTIKFICDITGPSWKKCRERFRKSWRKHYVWMIRSVGGWWEGEKGKAGKTKPPRWLGKWYERDEFIRIKSQSYCCVILRRDLKGSIKVTFLDVSGMFLRMESWAGSWGFVTSINPPFFLLLAF